MKAKKSYGFRTWQLAHVLLSMFCAAVSAYAAVVEYDASSGVTDLSLPTAWKGGVVPGSNDTAVVAGTGGTLTLGSPVALHGLVVSNLTANVNIYGETLTIGADGISPGGRVSPNKIVYFWCPIAITCDQEWYTYGQSMCFNGGISGTGTLTVRHYPSGSTTGQFVFKSLVDVPLIGWASTMALLESGAAMNRDLKIGYINNRGTLNMRQTAGAVGSVDAEKPFSSFFRTGHVVCDGRIFMGDVEPGAPLANVLFESTDSIVGDDSLTCPLATLDELGPDNFGALEVFGKFRMTGGVISNVMVRLYGGDFIMEDGRVWMRKGMVVRKGDEQGRRFLVNGANASVDVEYVDLGISNGENLSNWLVVSNGNVRVRDSVQLTRTDYSIADGSNTRLEVVDGTFETAGVKFGDSADGTVTNSAAVLNVKGGEFAVGKDGVTLGSDSWNYGVEDEALYGSWCKFWLSGGLYRAFASHCNTANMALEGDREIRVASGVTMTQQGMMSGPASLTKTGPGTLVLPKICAWTGTTTVAEGTLSVPAVEAKTPYIVFKADDLALSDGDSVEVWRAVSNNGERTNAFTKAISDVVKIPASPKYRANRIGGHATVSFNGVDEGLAMTGGSGFSDSSPTMDAVGLVVGVVFCASSSSVGNVEGTAFDAGSIVGQCFSTSSNMRKWTLSLTSDGIIGSGIRRGTAASGSTSTVWSDSPSVFDGKPHIAFYSWSANGKVRINLDGSWADVDDETGAPSISKNRMLIGVGEGDGGRDFRYFGGEIAEMRIYRDRAMSDEELDAVGLAMALEYGISYHPSSAVASGVNDTTSLPSASGIWRADDLAQSANADVTSWLDAVPQSNQSFTFAIGKAIAEGYGNDVTGVTSPTISPDAMNGHKAVRFDASKKTVLGLTGENNNGTRYLGNSGMFSVAVVARPFGGTDGVAGLIGQGLVWNDSPNKWRIGISGNEYAALCDQVEVSLRDASNPLVSTLGRPRFMFDGRPHVIICTIGTNVTVNVDGISTTRRAVSQSGRTGARTTLGFLEKINNGDNTVRFFTGDIAEVRFYKDKTLSVAEQNAIGRELALKYGADIGGYCAKTDSMFASPRVVVASGAALDGFAVPSGTTLECAGRLGGVISVGAGGVLDTVAAMPDASDANLILSDGSVLRIASDANGDTVPLHVRWISWPASGGMTIDLTSAGAKPRGTVLSWDVGTAPEVEGWTVLGGDRTTVLYVNEKEKCVKASTVVGTMIYFR